MAWALSARITKPLMQLSAFARMLPEHDLTTTQGLPEQIARIQSRHKDEVGDLASAFIYMDEQLRKNILNLLNETARQERFQSELNIARNIQLGLLPTKPSNKILEKVDLHAHMLPAKDVGGDLYDYFMLTDHSLCFAIGDVSDKGIPAALFMAITRTLIRTCAEDSTNPSILMERINNRLVANNPNMMFVTLIIGVLNLDTGELIWANAGHPPLCVIQPNHKLQLLEGRSGPACGVQANIPYKSFSTVIQSNEAIFGYTDGISEAMNVDQQFYGEQHLYYQLRMANLNTTSATEYSDLVISSVRQFAGDYDQSDDITTLVIKR